MADKAPASNNGNLGIEAYGRNDPILNRWMNSNSAEVYNYYLQYQRKAFRMFLDRQRDINEECGYPDTEEITAYDYYHLYEREPIAERVVSIFPQECWQVYPIISETGDVNEETDFELAIKELSKNLEADVADNDQSGSLYDGEEGDPLWEFLERADRLAGIGSYGAILLGIDDGRELQEPLDLNKTGPAASRHLLYMRILDETQCHIAEFETDPASRRYGRPKTYTVTIADSRKSTQVARASSGSIGSQDVTVHWTRIVHIVDTLDSSEIYHVPRMRTVYNRLYDLHKLYGGSAEMYWQAAFFGIAFETQPNSPYRLDAESINTIRDSMENYRNSLQRHLALPGVKANVLSPTVVDPTNHIDTYITAICVNKGIPKRVFMGSERGELSSSQDLRTWMSQVKRRQNRVVTPRIVIPFINRLVRCGVLPKPKSYTVDWEDIASLTDAEKAQVASQRTQAYATYVSGNVEAVMPYDRWLVDEMDYTQEEALEIMKAIEDQNTVDGEGEVNRITPDPEQQRMEQQQIEEDHFEKGRQDRKEEFKEQSKLAKQQGKAGRNISKAVTKNEQVLNAEYGTVMIDQVPFDLSHIHRVLEQTDDVLELEKEPHVTILYGMEDNLDIGALQNKLKMVRFPIYMDVEPELSIFKTSTADVLKFNVGSDQLKKLNELCKELPNANVHPKYQAHLTVAYLKPGTGEKYVGLSPPAGPYALAAHAVTYSDKDRNKLRLEMAPPPDDDAPIPAAVAMNKGGADNQSAYFPLQFNTELVNDNSSKGVWRTTVGIYTGVDNKDGYDPNQPRDKDGKWTKVGGGGSSVKASDNVLTYVKALPGSTGPVLKMDADGKHYVVKTYSDAKRAINEVIANEIYRELGIEVPPAHIDPNSPNIVISEYIQNTEPLGSFTETSGYPKLKQQIQEGFVADATLANWDVVGFSKDNILVTGSGTPIRVDQGGALLFRAKGQIKPGLTEEVVELQSLLKPSVNNQTAEVFKGITQDQIQAQAKHILSKRDAVLKIAEQDPDVHNLLKNRLDWLETKYGKGATAPVPSVPTPESPLAVASNHYSQATELHSAHGLVKYVYDNRGDVHFSKMDWKKMVVTNPDGIKDGVCWFPNNNSAVNKARRELLKNILPAGVQIKISRKSAKDLIGPGHNLVSWEDLTKQAKTVDLSFLSGSSPLIVGEYKGAKLISGSTKQLESLSLSDHSSVKHGTHFDYDIPTPAPKGYESKAQQWWKELSEPERWAVKDFTASGSQEIRKSFTQGTPTITAKNLVKAISKAPTIQGRLVRHVHGSYATAQADALAAMPPGTYWADVAPMSTSRKHNGLGSGTNGLSLIIQSKTARLVEKFSSHPAEQEAIAMPKTLYRVMQVHRNSTFSGSSIKRTIVELEEL